MGPLMLLSAGTCWGFSGLFISMLQEQGLGPMSIVLVRYAAATVVLVPLVAAWSAHEGRNLFRVTRRELLFCVLVGLVANTCGGTFSNIAVAHVGMSVTTVLLYTAPVFGCVHARSFFGERFTRRKAVAILFNFAGVLLVVLGGGGLGQGGLDLPGVAAGLGYGLCYSTLAVLSHPIAGSCHPLSIVFYSAASVAVVTLPMALVETSPALLAQPSVVGLGLVYGGLLSVIANITYQLGMALGVETSRVPVITSVEVPVSAICGALAFSEAMGELKVGGIALVLVSIAVMNLNMPANEVHGVRVLTYGSQLSQAFAASADLYGAVDDLRKRREQPISIGKR